MEIGNITKAATFKRFLHLSFKNTKSLYFVTVLLSIFMRQTLTDDFWGLHKNMNCAFPLKKKYLRANHASFVTKEFRKAIMERTRLRNIYLKQRTETTKVAYNQQRNKCVSILKKTKRSYFESLDVKFVKDNKKFWKKISPLFSNKIKSKEKITLVENDEIISSDIEVAKTFQNFFSSIVKNLTIKRDETHLSKTTQDNPVSAGIEKFSKHPSIVSIKKRMETSSNKFSFKYEERMKFLTEIQKLNSRKASQQNDIPVKVLKGNSDIFSYILIIILITFYLVINFQNTLKRQI